MSEAQTFRTEKSQPEADPPAAEMGLISEGSIRSKVQIVQNVLNGLNGLNILNQYFSR
jgi:hypothetical protein